MNSNRKNILILGGGLAGLAAAVALDEQGHRVRLIEKKPILGGRTMSFADRKTGLQIDNGQHLLIGAYHATFEFLQKIGASHKVKPHRPTLVNLYDDNFKLNTFAYKNGKAPWGLLQALATFGGLSWLDKLGVLRLGFSLMRMNPQNLTKLSKISVTEWLKSFGQSQKARRQFWDILTLATLNDSPDLASADALATVLIKSYLAGPSDGFLVFPKTTLTELFVTPTTRYLNERGAKIETGLGAKEIRILNSQVQDVILDSGEHAKADIYISAMPPHRLLSILPKTFVEATPSLNALKNLDYSPIASINLFFDGTPMTHEFLGATHTSTHWFFNKGCHDTPIGRVQHVVGVLSAAYDLLEKPREAILKQVLQDFQALHPQSTANCVHATVNIERQATLSCRVGVNQKRPKSMILNNFFTIGDWINTGLPPTIEGAILSAHQLPSFE